MFVQLRKRSTKHSVPPRPKSRDTMQRLGSMRLGGYGHVVYITSCGLRPSRTRGDTAMIPCVLLLNTQHTSFWCLWKYGSATVSGGRGLYFEEHPPPQFSQQRARRQRPETTSPRTPDLYHLVRDSGVKIPVVPCSTRTGLPLPFLPVRDDKQSSTAIQNRQLSHPGPAIFERRYRGNSEAQCSRSLVCLHGEAPS